MGLGETVNKDDVAVIILNGVFSDYDIEVRLLEYGDDIKLREAWILKSLTHQYYRVQKKKLSEGGNALHASAQGSMLSKCQLCGRPGYIAEITRARSAKEGTKNQTSTWS